MNKVLIGILAVIILIILSIVSLYNGIILKHEYVTNRWAQVETVLQRRFDLIPNLVNTVKGYAEHERTLFENITNARSRWMNASGVNDKVQAASAMDSAISRLLMVVENYPQLKADSSFLKLQDELAGAENRISVERMRYNDAVRDYNVAIRTFPGNVIAGQFGFKSASEYFKANEGASEAPVVKF